MPELIPSTVIDDVIAGPPRRARRRARPLRRDLPPQLVPRPAARWSRATARRSRPAPLVGLHFHLHQADYWYALRGKVRVVLHDLRVGSRTDGATEVIDLDGDVDQGVYIPPGVAHGFAALTDVLLTYLVDNYYDDSDELGLAWDDPAVGADWGVTDPILSDAGPEQPAARRHPRRHPAPPVLLTPGTACGGRPRALCDGRPRAGRRGAAVLRPADPVE